jgi:hypothetical protein
MLFEELELIERRGFSRQVDATAVGTELLAEGYVVHVQKDEAAVPSRRWLLEAYGEPRTNGDAPMQELRDTVVATGTEVTDHLPPTAP